MLYTPITIGNETYKLRLTTKASIALERALGRNPLVMFMDMDKGVMPKLADLLEVLHAALQPNHHSVTLDKTYELYDTYVEEGNSMVELISILVDVFQNSGYISKPGAEVETNEKN